MDDLSRIEGSYGSVAEYERVREEEANERWWNSLPKSQQNWYEIENEYKNRMYDEMADKLTPTVTDEAKAAVEEYKARTKDLDWTDYKERRQGNEIVHETMQKIAGKYGLSFHDEAPAVEQGQFYVSYDYIDGGRYHYKFSDAMDKDTFMKAYSDMYEMDKGMTVRYRDTSGREPDRWGVAQDKHYISNSSLASIRMTDFRNWGVDDPEGDRIIKDTKAKYKEIVDKAKSDFNREHAAEIELERQNRGYEFDDICY